MLKYGSVILLSIFVLCGCAGTVHRDNNALRSSFAADSVSEVEVRMSEEAQKLQANNTQFSTKDLLGYLERKLDGKDLLKSNSAYRLQVTVTRFRIRSAFSAVMWGIMAGTDSVEGKIRVLNREGKLVHSFDVSASYGLGGWGGGQDGMRMNWLYGKFAELTIAELTGKTEFSDVKRNNKEVVKARPKDASDPLVATAPERVVNTPAAIPETTDVTKASATPASAPVTIPEATMVAKARKKEPGDALVTKARESNTTGPVKSLETEKVVVTRSAAVHNFVIPADSSFAALGNADAIPYVDQRAKDSYALYLTRPKPRAYVVARSGAWAYRIGKDALPNALAVCEAKARSTCYLYAIDDHVVWQSDNVAGETMRRKVLAEIAANQNAETVAQPAEQVALKVQPQQAAQPQQAEK